MAHLPEVAARELRPPQEPLRFRSDVFFRDVIDTQREATAKLLLRGQATLTIRELSRVELREGVAPTDPTRTRSVVSLLYGAFRAITAASLMRGDEMEVRTANAVAAIRGTDVWVEFYPPSTTLPPLPVASLEPRVQRASFQLAQAAPQDNTRIFVLAGQSCVAGVCAGPGEGLEMEGNLPPRLFRFTLDYIQQILASLALGLQGQTGKDLDQILAALQDQAAGDAGGGPEGGGFALPPWCTSLACVSTNIINPPDAFKNAPPTNTSFTFQTLVGAGSIDFNIPPFNAAASADVGSFFDCPGCSRPQNATVRTTGAPLQGAFPRQGNVNITITNFACCGEFGFGGFVNMSARITQVPGANGQSSLRGTITGGSFDTCGDGCTGTIRGGTITPKAR